MQARRAMHARDTLNPLISLAAFVETFCRNHQTCGLICRKRFILTKVEMKQACQVTLNCGWNVLKQKIQTLRPLLYLNLVTEATKTTPKFESKPKILLKKQD